MPDHYWSAAAQRSGALAVRFVIGSSQPRMCSRVRLKSRCGVVVGVVVVEKLEFPIAIIGNSAAWGPLPAACLACWWSPGSESVPVGTR